MDDAACYTLSHRGILDQPGRLGGMKALILSMLCGLLLWPAAGSAELYKWTDEQGNVHITDIPPPGAQKKSAPPAIRPPRSVPSNKKATDSADFPEWPREPVLPATILTKERPVQAMTGELSPRQATLMSTWQTFEGSRVGAKAPVHRWKDERGLDRFSDVRPTGKSRTGATEKHASLVRPANKE